MKHIDAYLTSLESQFGKPKPPFKMMLLEIEFKVDDVTEMVKIIADAFFPLGKPRILVGRVRNGGPAKAGAWLQCIEPMQPYGSNLFREMRVQVCLRETLLKEASVTSVAFAIAHELSHLMLFSVVITEHDEKYVDLLAMHLGFAEVYKDGKFYGEAPPSPPSGDVLKDILAELTARPHRKRLGHLTEQEIAYACRKIITRRGV